MNEEYSAFRSAFFEHCERANTIAITAHYSPDDDSIASVLSVYTILTTKYPNKSVRVVYTGRAVERYNIFHNFDNIEFVDDVANHLEGTELLIVLDVNRLARISNRPENITALGIPAMIAIDHHSSAPDEFTLALIEPTLSSNAELVYRALGAEDMLTKELAELFLLGILGDTGNFAYVNPSQSGVFAIAKGLIEMVGMPIDAFRARYGGIPKHIVPLLQLLVQNMAYSSITGWPDAQYSFIDRATMLAGGYTDEDMSAASHIYMGQYLPRIQGQGWGLVATPREDGSARISGRSLKGSVNVRSLFERMGIGGGHDRASGAAMQGMDGKPAVLAILEWMKHNQPLD
ncbi:MAG TPA: DHH family phosphoesterase [Candidatus Paceibacterota bacterium]